MLIWYKTNEEEESSMTKQSQKMDYYKVVGERIEYCLKALGYTQDDLSKQCISNGFSISQATISKIVKGVSGLNISNIVGICETLHLDLNEVLSSNPELNTVTISESSTSPASYDSLIADCTRKEFTPYLGDYFCYFYRTKSNESDMLCGTLRFEKAKNSKKCIVSISFETGKYTEDGKKILKKYTGEACISLSMQAVYCTVQNDEIGEICYFVFSYRPILYEKLECKLAAVLTVSAGGNRMPTLHRMLISRKKLSDETLSLLEGQLNLNASEILISHSAFNAMLKDDVPESFRQYFCEQNEAKPLDQIFTNVASIPYYYLNESVIRDSFMPPEDKQKMICLLRKYSYSPKYNKIGTKADELVYQVLISVQERESLKV